MFLNLNALNNKKIKFFVDQNIFVLVFYIFKKYTFSNFVLKKK